MKRFFGTDGIRGRANEAPLDPVTLIEIGAVLGRLMRERGGIDGGILIGHDGRRSAAMIFGALSAGLCAEGVEVFDGGLLTTPALAHETRLGNYKAGIIISASHNPAHDNGIKIFGENGQKISDSIEHAIEEQLATAVDAVRGRPGIVHRIERSTGGEAHEYRRFLKKTFHDVDLRGMRVLVDCAHGGGSSSAPTILREFGATVVVRNDAPTGDNINDRCGSTHLESLQRAVLKDGADVGFAFDGDADRCLAVDHEGNVVDGDQIMAVLALSMKDSGRLVKDTVVATVMSNLGFVHAMKSAGIGVRQTKVGDRYVLEAMRVSGYSLGGEQSGHVIMSEHATTGDGVLTALHVLERMAATRSGLRELASVVTRLPQVLVNVPDVDKSRADDDPVVAAAVAEEEAALGDSGRILLRPSGTENLVRVMVEAGTEEDARSVAGRLADVVKRQLAL